VNESDRPLEEYVLLKEPTMPPKIEGKKEQKKNFKKGWRNKKKSRAGMPPWLMNYRRDEGQFRFLRAACLANLKVKGSLGLIWAKASTILSSRPFIPLSVFHSF
jgi:hypothetical protein